MKVALRKYILRHQLLKPGDKILLAVSGGCDSMVMADLLIREYPHVAFAHCNFGLRGEESDGDEAFVKERAEKYRVPIFTVRFDEEDFNGLEGHSIQMAARKLRYEWFENIRVQNGYDLIATAHHLDDQVETFFINLLRGTGIAGLHGIQPRAGRVIRPMLFATRSEIEAYAKKRGLPYRDDSSNATTKYLRNQIRHELIPLLKKINPEVSSAISRTISAIGAYESIGKKYLQEEIAKIMNREGKQVKISIPGLQSLSPIDLFAWELLSPFGFNNPTITDILASLDGQSGKRFLSPTHTLIKDRDYLIVEPVKTHLPIQPANENNNDGIASVNLTQDVMFLSDLETTKIDSPISLLFRKEFRTKEFNLSASPRCVNLDFEKLTAPLTLRRWQPGDTFFPLGMTKKQKISDFLINIKLPLTEKADTWVLASGQSIVWIVGKRIDHRFCITARTKWILTVEKL